MARGHPDHGPDTGCFALAAALRSGAMPALEDMFLFRISASAASKTAVFMVLVSRRGLSSDLSMAFPADPPQGVPGVSGAELGRTLRCC